MKDIAKMVQRNKWTNGEVIALFGEGFMWDTKYARINPDTKIIGES